MSAYTKQVQWTFEADGEEWALTIMSDKCMILEETRKNGQEDTHMGAELTLKDDGQWDYEWGRDQIEMYSSEETADAILEFVNEHGMPKE